MARPRKPKVVKNTSLPDSVQLRELLDSLLDEAVGYLREQDRCKSLIKGVMETLTHNDSKLQLDNKYANQLIKARYDLVKAKEKAAVLQSVLDDLAVLKGD
jgi:hypothetical protein